VSLACAAITIHVRSLEGLRQKGAVAKLKFCNCLNKKTTPRKTEAQGVETILAGLQKKTKSQGASLDHCSHSPQKMAVGSEQWILSIKI
jgi:hypothetical protein